MNSLPTKQLTQPDLIPRRMLTIPPAREANVDAQAEAAAATARSAADALAQAKIGKGCEAAIKWANQEAASLGKW